MSDEQAVAVRREPTAALPALTVSEVSRQIGMVKELMSKVMHSGMHYGVIPGCGDKPTLYLAGAQLTNKLFRFVNDPIETEVVDMGNGHREYRSRVTLRHFDSGKIVGCGVGSCSTMESKFRYRKAERVCPKCHAAAIRKSKYPPKDNPDGEPGWYCHAKVGGCGAGFEADDPGIIGQATGRVENPDIADTFNTVCKMAKKRAYVDASITAGALSEFVTQDIEDFGIPAGPTHAVSAEAEVIDQSPIGSDEPPPPDEQADVQQAPAAAPAANVKADIIARINACESTGQLTGMLTEIGKSGLGNDKVVMAAYGAKQRHFVAKGKDGK